MKGVKVSIVSRLALKVSRNAPNLAAVGDGFVCQPNRQRGISPRMNVNLKRRTNLTQ